MQNPSILEQQLDEMRSDMRDVRTAVTRMAEAITKLSVLEERNMVAAATIEKILVRAEKIETRVAAVEIAQVKFEAHIAGMTTAMRFMWSGFGGLAIFLATQLFKYFGGG